jgi:hypothetical protein
MRNFGRIHLIGATVATAAVAGALASTTGTAFAASAPGIGLPGGGVSTPAGVTANPSGFAGPGDSGFVHYGFMNPGYRGSAQVRSAIDGTPQAPFLDKANPAPTLPQHTALYRVDFYNVPCGNCQDDHQKVAGTPTDGHSDWDGADLVLLPGVAGVGDKHWYMYCGSDQEAGDGMIMERQAFHPGYGFQQTLHGGGSGGDFWIRWFHHALFAPWGG